MSYSRPASTASIIANLLFCTFQYNTVISNIVVLGFEGSPLANYGVLACLLRIEEASGHSSVLLWLYLSAYQSFWCPLWASLVELSPSSSCPRLFGTRPRLFGAVWLARPVPVLRSRSALGGAHTLPLQYSSAWLPLGTSCPIQYGLFRILGIA